MPRIDNDAYFTPIYLAKKLVKTIEPHITLQERPSILEPHAGKGAFITALKDLPCDIEACDIVMQNDEVFHSVQKFYCRDFLQHRKHYDWVIGNPPFKNVLDHVIHALDLSDNVAFLLPISFLATQQRLEFWNEHPFTFAYVLSKRPKFGEFKGTDSRDYAFFVWIDHYNKKAKQPKEIRWLWGEK